MSEEREPFPTEDPREKETSGQNAEESPAAVKPDEEDDDSNPRVEDARSGG
jgi:hypothetical protein